MLLPIISLAVLALAVSLDGFSVGVMYGLRKIRIPILSIAIISACSGIIILTSMQIGVFLLRYISPDYAKLIGALILVCIGMWAIIQIFMQRNNDIELPVTVHKSNVEQERDQQGQQEQVKPKETVLTIELKWLGIIIQILRKPSSADIDRSGNISASEATFLGIALSLDAFGAGIGAALIGYNPFLTSILIAISSGVFITVGLRIGYIFSNMGWIRRLSFLPGCILIIMGIMKMM
jgi:putative Mn2+ efflux pump MntP